MSRQTRALFGNVLDFQRRHRFVFLFGGLLALLIVAPMLESTGTSREVLAILTTIILCSAVFSILAASRWLALGTVFLGLLNLFTIWWEYAFWSPNAALLHYLSMVIFFFLIIVIILVEVTRATSVNPNVIYGAVTVYMLIGFIWGFLFAALFILQPGAFRDLAIPVNTYFSLVPFWFLSFQTLTTLGYDGPAPGSDLARSLALIEAVAGQLYLVLQVSLLVGLRVSEVAAKRREKN